jgi:hypothetical protein
MKKRYDRRRFLKKAAAAAGVVAGFAGLKAVPSGAKTPPAREGVLRATDPPPTLMENAVFLPRISTGRHDPEPRPEPDSKLGVHTIRPDGALGFIQQVHDGGSFVAVVKALDDIGYLQLVKSISPETTRVARRRIPDYEGIDASGDPVAKAQAYMSQHMSRWEPDREWVDYWEVLNEADPPSTAGQAGLGDFHIACMNIADQNGYNLALFSYSTGVPEWWEWEAIVSTGVFARAKSGGHILSLHEYSWPNVDLYWGEPLPNEDGTWRPAYPDRGSLKGRYRHLYRDFLIPQNQVIPLVITEAGYDPMVNRDAPGWGEVDWKSKYVSEMAWYDGIMQEDSYVIGCALFTLGPTPTWEDWDYEELLDELAAYIIATIDQT